MDEKVNSIFPEPIYTDKFGKPIEHGSMVKINHFIGVNNQGKGRKKYYMYKLIIFHNGYWYGIHSSSIKNLLAVNLLGLVGKHDILKLQYGYCLDSTPFDEGGIIKYKQVAKQLMDYEVLYE